jgi:hypothetical protein
MYAVGALVMILLSALVVKPLVTGQPLNTGLPVATTPKFVLTTPTAADTPTPPRPVSPTPSLPAVIPTWDGKVVTLGFVESEPVPDATRSDPDPVNTSMTSYAKISGKFGGTTRIMEMPFPYWELVYTVDPVTATEPGSVKVIQTDGGVPHSGVQGSYSGVIPEFTVTVIDAADPDRVIRTISPPGGINTAMWKKSDPRPWTEKFYEGQRGYYFIITSTLLNSYSIDIRIPSKYIGLY